MPKFNVPVATTVVMEHIGSQVTQEPSKYPSSGHAICNNVISGCPTCSQTVQYNIDIRNFVLRNRDPRCISGNMQKLLAPPSEKNKKPRVSAAASQNSKISELFLSIAPEIMDPCIVEPALWNVLSTKGFFHKKGFAT